MGMDKRENGKKCVENEGRAEGRENGLSWLSTAMEFPCAWQVIINLSQENSCFMFQVPFTLVISLSAYRVFDAFLVFTVCSFVSVISKTKDKIT